MSLFARLRSVFFLPRGKKAEAACSQTKKTAFHDVKASPSPEGGACLVFANTGEVIQAESILREQGMKVRVMAPPPALRTGCDMVLVIPLMHGFRAVALLEEDGLPPLRLAPAGENLLEPVSLFQTKDYGDWIMVRAANMKITVEKASGLIVNVSGGGCPDVPYLAARLTGKNVHEADPAGEKGQTLCGYALHLAAQELRKLHAGEGKKKHG